MFILLNSDSNQIKSSGLKILQSNESVLLANISEYPHI